MSIATEQPPRPWFSIACRVLRDLCLLGVGLIGLEVAPPSMVQFTDQTSIVSATWAAMFIFGTLVSLYGITADAAMPEIGGCTLVAAAFLIWTIAALRQPDVSASTYQVALVFMSGVFGQGYRIWTTYQPVRR